MGRSRLAPYGRRVEGPKPPFHTNTSGLSLLGRGDKRGMVWD